MTVKVGKTFVYGDFEPRSAAETLGRVISSRLQGSESEPEFAVEIVRELSETCPYLSDSRRPTLSSCRVGWPAHLSVDASTIQAQHQKV